MLAHVESAGSLASPLHYNTQKVQAEEAVFLDAHNFWQEKADLSMRDIRQRFDDLTVLNERSEKNIIHISVNFHPYDKLSDTAMTHIAEEFMKGIGFGDQPWLTYRHNDAGHPHMHIVTTSIRPDGSRILNDLRSPRSLIHICGDIEKKHNLAKAMFPPWIDRSGQKEIPRLTYGKIPTRTGIEMVLEHVLENYKFTSFESFNAVLSLYNVRADRGNPEGVMYLSRGLYYRMIDEQGRKVGAPIKASDLYHKPTLDVLEEKCRLNQRLINESDRQSMRISIDFHLAGKVDSLHKFTHDMAVRQKWVIIPAFTRRQTRGAAPVDSPGMFYVDANKLKVFRDTELGKDYTAEAILQRCGLDKSIPQMVQEQKIELKAGERALLNNLDLKNTKTRDLLLRLTPQHDRVVEQQKQAESQSHRLRHGHSL